MRCCSQYNGGRMLGMAAESCDVLVNVQILNLILLNRTGMPDKDLQVHTPNMGDRYKRLVQEINFM